MSRKETPYFPLYVQDFLTDEKLIDCSPAATGVNIRLMCILNKKEVSGQILLKQKDKQSTNQIISFTIKLALYMTYCFDEFGQESTPAKYFENSVNIMKLIIAKQYNHWQEKGLLAHFTTNFNPEEIETNYHESERSRLAEIYSDICLFGINRRRY